MTELILCRHRARLLHQCGRGCIAHDADLPRLRRKLESVRPATCGHDRRGKPEAIAPPTARRIIVPMSIARRDGAIQGRFSVGNVDASRHGPGVPLAAPFANDRSLDDLFGARAPVPARNLFSR